jgi:hypothetical protein
MQPRLHRGEFGFRNKPKWEVLALRQETYSVDTLAASFSEVFDFAVTRGEAVSFHQGDSVKNRNSRRLVLRAGMGVVAALLLSLAASAATKQSFTGQVSDAMCGREHMEGTAAQCTRSCVQHGSKYSLLVGDKVYTLETTDKAALATLDKQAGMNATVTGTLTGDKLEVSAVEAAK